MRLATLPDCLISSRNLSRMNRIVLRRRTLRDEFGMTESAVRQASYRLRQRYRQVLREEIAHTVMAAWRYRR